jgi:hypothetical protein
MLVARLTAWVEAPVGDLGGLPLDRAVGCAVYSRVHCRALLQESGMNEDPKSGVLHPHPANSVVKQAELLRRQVLHSADHPPFVRLQQDVRKALPITGRPRLEKSIVQAVGALDTKEPLDRSVADSRLQREETMCRTAGADGGPPLG